MSLELQIPVKIISEANNFEHWTDKRNRKVSQQVEVMAELRKALEGRRVALPCIITLTRIGPKSLDPDNLANGFKAVQDAIAKVLNFDDGDVTKVRWLYDQTPITRRSYSIKIKIESKVEALPLNV